MLWFMAMMTAGAQQARSIDPGDFVVQIGPTTATVQQVGVPFGASLRNPDRVCRVGVYIRDGEVVPEVADDCHAGIAWAAEDALSLLEVDVASPPSGDRRLFELWFVFPSRKGGEVRTLVRQAWDAELTLRPEWLELLEYELEGVLPPRYPEAALDIDTEITTCDVDVDVGSQGLVSRVEVRRCDDVFHDEAKRAAHGWLVRGAALENVSVMTGLTFGMRFERSLDGEGGKAIIDLPPTPDLGGRDRWRADEPPPAPPVRPTPTAEPLFVVDHRSFAEVGIYDLVWPEGVKSAKGLSCDVLFQVNSAQQVWVWPERCDEEVQGRVVDAGRSWYLAAGRPERAERYARFRATFQFSADGNEVSLLLPGADLVSDVKTLPAGVITYRQAKAMTRVPPRLPRELSTPTTRDGVECQFRVEINTRGKPAEITALSCPGDYVAAASKAISKWRWQPAQVSGEPLASSTQVRVRFGGAP